MAKKVKKPPNKLTRPPRANTEELFETLQADLGKYGVVIQRGTELEGRFDLRRPCGIASLDIDTGGGLPAGGLSQVDGPDGCIAADSFLRYEVWSVDGERINHKGGTIKHLYERFHDCVLDGTPNQGRHLERKEGIIFYVKSVDHEGRIIRNQVLDVVKTGHRTCHEVKTDDGQRLLSTGDHKYLTPTGFKALSDLKIGDQVLVHNNTRNRTRIDGKKHRIHRPETYIPYHGFLPHLPTKVVHDTKTGNDYLYYRGNNARLTYEAHMNSMDFAAYMSLLKRGRREEIDKCRFLPSNIHIHHRDEDVTNNAISNLQLVDPAQHGLIHIEDRLGSLSFIASIATIISITEVPEQETYDIRCGHPYNNYVAEGIIVHNSGKNMLAYRYLGEVQALYEAETNIFMLCMEFPFDKDYAAFHGFHVPYSTYEIGVRQRARKEEGLEPYTKDEVKKMMSTKGKGTFHLLRGSAEANLDAVVEMIRSNAYQIGIIDSWDSMLTAPEEEADLADDPRIANSSSVQTKWMKKVQGALTPRKRCPECWSLNLDFKKHASGSYSYYCGDTKDCGWKGKDVFLEENETTIIGIRQVRANMRKTKFGPEYKVGGAWALKHGKLVDIQLRPGERIMSKDGKVKIGKEINYEITKGKAGTHEGRKGMLRYFFGPPEVDVDHNFFTTAITMGLIRRGGSVYYIDPEEGEPLKFAGKGTILDALADDPELKNILWKKMLLQAGLHHIRYRDV